ncbi:MAG TPA: mechanosensitive ion channel domain-containing protein [Steroidobacteraceae bacterium]
MDAILGYVTVRLEILIADVLGAAANQSVAGSITWADLAAVACYLVLAAAVSVAVTYFIKRRSRSLPAVQSTTLPNHVLTAIRKPIHILIWIYGVYFAATPVLLKLRPEQGLLEIREVLLYSFDLGAFVAFFWFLFRATHAVQARLALWAAGTPSKIDNLLVPLVGTILRMTVLLVGVIIVLPMLGLPARYAAVIGKLTSMMFIAVVAILLARGVKLFQQVVFTRFDINAADNLQARKVYTQIHVISRVIYVVITILAVSAILMLFQQVRQVGTSLLASAGVLGIIAGFAAQKTLANLLAGFQVALAQPVRYHDVVVVEGEWGRIEEITLTYVVVHIWDDRRLVLPLSYFIEKPFQNWTRASADLLGSVFVWVDYAFPVEEGRAALKAIIEASHLWDKRFWNLQVTDATEKTMQLRVLATAADSSKSFDLRCEIREKFIAYIQRNHPQGLPRFRAELLRPTPAESAAG